jgi:hypothetical protein
MILCNSNYKCLLLPPEGVRMVMVVVIRRGKHKCGT